MLLYLTYAEQPSGVYSGQVTDVVRFLKNNFREDLRLLAFISLREFRKTRRQLLSELPDSVVLPMLPKAGNWRFNTLILKLVCILYRVDGIIARNVIAANMALRLKRSGTIKRFTFDGRGAIAAEWHEYDVRVIPSWKAQVKELEKNAVINSDFRIAVSWQLVEYWREVYGYKGNQHIVIPCTLDSKIVAATTHPVDTGQSRNLRSRHGFNNEDIVLAYAGSTAGWQSFALLETVLEPYLAHSSMNKVLFLSQKDKNIDRLSKKFSGQVIQRWVPHHGVGELLSACDMGILIRENSTTNRVAAPTKFAEYLAAGLPVLISENLGDYSAFVLKEKCGMMAGNEHLPLIKHTAHEEKNRMKSLVKRYFTKEAHINAYRELIAAMTGGSQQNPVSVWRDPSEKK